MADQRWNSVVMVSKEFRVPSEIKVNEYDVFRSSFDISHIRPVCYIRYKFACRLEGIIYL